VTGDDEDNLVSCQVAKHMFNVPRTIARMSNPKNEAIFKKLGIDNTISSTRVILEYIEEEVPTHRLTRLLNIRDKGLEIVVVKITPDSTTVGKALKDISLPPGSVLPIIISKERGPHVPAPDTVIQSEDQIIAVTHPELEGPLRAALSGS
jgi:trk system potassium uptake protein TrkA